MKIAHHGMLMLILPVALELVLIGSIFALVRNVDIDAHRGTTARIIIGQTEELLSSMYAQSAAILLIQQNPVDFAFERFQIYRKRADDSLKRLESLSASEPSVRRDVVALKNAADLTQGYLDESERLAETGQAGDYRKKLDALKGAYSNLAGRVYNITAHYRSYDENALASQEKASQAIKLALLLGAVVGVLAAAILGVGFNRGIKKRLNSVLENIYNYETEIGVRTAPVAGKDELTSIDSTFHSMARVIVDKNEQLKGAEARVRAALEGLTLGVLVLTTDFKVKYANPAVGAMLKVEPTSLQSLDLNKLIEGEAGQKIDINSASSSGKQTEVFLHMGDVRIPVELTVNEFIGPDGLCFIASLQDITERHEIEQLRRQFVAMVSHDLRTPLTAIRLMLDLVSSGAYGNLNDSGTLQINAGRQNCSRLIALVNDLLDVEKLRRDGNLELALAPCLVEQILEEAISTVSPLAANYAIKLEIENAMDLEIVVDRDRLIQALVNLLSNAIKFSPVDGLVKLTSRCVDDFCELQVIDQGRGIPEAKQKEIFESFVQVCEEDSRNQRGAGLGLAICKSIITAHKGEIGVNSELGKGSVFWIRLPLPQSIEVSDEDADMASSIS
jgi:signal transduction histidine kinase